MEEFTLNESFLSQEYSNSAFKIYKILIAYNENKEKGIRVAKELIKSKSNFNRIVEFFKNHYSNAEDFLSILDDIADSYDTKEVKKSTKYVDREKLSNDNTEKKALLKKIHKSGLSVMDYYFYNSTPIGFNKFFSERCSSNDKLAIDIARRENKTYPLIIDIIIKINNDEIDYVGYYEATKLNPYHLIAIARDNDIYTDTLGIFVRALRLNKQLNIEKELNGVLVINEEQVPRSIKEQAINYLNNIDAPVDTVVYDNMVKRLIRKSSK